MKTRNGHRSALYLLLLFFSSMQAGMAQYTGVEYLPDVVVPASEKPKRDYSEGAIGPIVNHEFYNTKFNSNVPSGLKATLVRACASKQPKNVFIIEGFDPLDEYNTYWFLQYNSKLIKQFTSSGYNVIYVDFHCGADYIENNSAALQKLLARYENDGSEKVVMGFSMGGLIARHALCSMPNHGVSTYVAFDSPHNGAYISAGMQALAMKTYDIFHGLGWDIPDDVQKQQKKLWSPAATQMLLTHGRNSSAHKNFTFINTLRDMGLPKNCRNIAISNGSKRGTRLPFESGSLIFRGKVLYGISADVYAASEAGGLVAKLETSTLLFNKSEVFRLSMGSFARDYENAPGGYLDLVRELCNEIPEGQAVSVNDVCFIPTLSAIAHNNFYAPELRSLSIDYTQPGKNVLDDTDFDEVYFQDNNSLHVLSIIEQNPLVETDPEKAWTNAQYTDPANGLYIYYRPEMLALVNKVITQEIMPIDKYMQSKTIAPASNVSRFEGYKTITIGANVTPSSWNKHTPIGPVVFQTGSKSSIKGTEYISLQPGVAIENNANVAMEISSFNSMCCQGPAPTPLFISGPPERCLTPTSLPKGEYSFIGSGDDLFHSNIWRITNPSGSVSIIDKGPTGYLGFYDKVSSKAINLQFDKAGTYKIELQSTNSCGISGKPASLNVAVLTAAPPAFTQAPKLTSDPDAMFPAVYSSDISTFQTPSYIKGRKEWSMDNSTIGLIIADPTDATYMQVNWTDKPSIEYQSTRIKVMSKNECGSSAWSPSVLVSVVRPCDDFYEPNETKEAASGSANARLTVEGEITSSSDVDWFRYKSGCNTIGTCTNVFLELRYSVNTDLALYDSTGRLLATSTIEQDEKGRYRKVVFDNKYRVTYLIKVWGVDGAKNSPNISDCYKLEAYAFSASQMRMEGAPTGLGREYLESTSSFHVYPNPSTSGTEVTLQANGSVASDVRTIRILDGIGKVVSHQQVFFENGKATVSMAGINPGVYTIEASDLGKKMFVVR